MAGDADKARLIAELEAARRGIAEASHALQEAGVEVKRKLNVPKRLGDSYRRQPGIWMGAAALAGFLLSRLPARKKVVYVDRGSGGPTVPPTKFGKIWSVVKVMANLAKPLVTTLVTERLAGLAQRMAGQNPGPGEAEGQPAAEDDFDEEADPHS
jgi:hypothetical protein